VTNSYRDGGFKHSGRQPPCMGMARLGQEPAVGARLLVYQSPHQPPSDSIYHPALAGPNFLHKTGGVLCGMMSGNLEKCPCPIHHT
jgi:hypothetical protein